MSKRFDMSSESTYTPPTMKWVGTLVFGAVFVCSTAFAQADGDGAKTKKAETDISKPAEAPKVDDVESAIAADSAKLSAKEKQKRAESMVSEIGDSQKRATELLGEARKAQDIFQLNCINERFHQIKGLGKVSGDSQKGMWEAMAEGKDDLATHFFTKIAVAHQKVLILRAEVEQCLGATAIYTGKTEVKVEVEGGDDGTTDPTADPTTGGTPTTPQVGSKS